MTKEQLAVFEPATDLPDLPKGWDYALVSGFIEAEGDYAYVAKESPKDENGKPTGPPVEVARIQGCVFAPVPTEPETSKGFVDGLKKAYTNRYGETVTLNGTPAAAFKVAYDKHESVRGLVRKGEIVDAEGCQANLTSNGLGNGRRSREVDTETINEAYNEIHTPEDLQAFIRTLGLKVING